MKKTEEGYLWSGQRIGRMKSYFSGLLRILLVGFLVLLQFLVIGIAPFLLQNVTVYFYVIIDILSFFVIMNLVNDDRNPSYKVAWISIVLMLPLSGHIMFALWGKKNAYRSIDHNVRRLMGRGESYLSENPALSREYILLNPVKGRLSRYMSRSGFPIYKNNAVRYYGMAQDAFEEMFEDIRQAEHFLLLNFFIVAEGALWDRLHEILIERVKAGVEVKFMYDDFGAAIRTEKHFRRKLEEEGIQVHVFNPIHRYTEKLYMNFRSHQKIVVIDGNIGYTGGFNIADEYANLIDRFGVWKDTGVRVEGDVVWGMTVTFLQMWEICANRQEISYAQYRPTKSFPPSEVYCHAISDGPVNNPENPIECVYKQMLYAAREYVYITTPYLIIDDDMKNAMVEAAKSGVDVRIITPNIPDKKRIKLLTNYNYGCLLKNGIRIYEYTPGFIHAKMILMEGCCVVGTVNLDYRSFYLHYENGLWISNRAVTETIRKDFMDTIGQSREITYEEWLCRPFSWRIAQPVLNLFSTLL